MEAVGERLGAPREEHQEGVIYSGPRGCALGYSSTAVYYAQLSSRGRVSIPLHRMLCFVFCLVLFCLSPWIL